MDIGISTVMIMSSKVPTRKKTTLPMPASDTSATSTKQYGVAVIGYEELDSLLSKCLLGIRMQDGCLPDEFKVIYKHSLEEGEEEFTAVKITYEEQDEREAEPGSPA